MKKSSIFLIYTVFNVVTVGTIITSVLITANRTSQSVVDNTRSSASEIPPNSNQQLAMERAEGVLLDGIPDFPAYPGSAVKYSYVKRDVNKIGYEIGWEAPARVYTVTKWYLDTLPLDGWTITGITDGFVRITPPGPLSDIEFMVAAEKGNTSVNLIVENEDGGPESEISAEFPLRKP